MIGKTKTIRGPRGRRRIIGALAAGVLSGAALAGQMDSATYYLLREGMSMSELLVRAGPPDLVTVPGGEVVQRRFGSSRGGQFRRSQIRHIEEWHYIPGPDYHDPWITLVTFRSGRILDVRRTKVFSRYRGSRSSSGSNASRAREREAGAGTSQATRTLEAAERYAATRLRLKKKIEQEEGGSEPASVSSSPKIYHGIDVHGATYFGDVPLQ